MTDIKDTDAKEKNTNNTTDISVSELVRIVDNHLNPGPSTPTAINSTGISMRTHTSPLMGTSARAAKRRIETDSGPMRIEGTDIYNQQLQHHYQNVRQIFDDQEISRVSNIDTSYDSPQSINLKRDYIEQKFKTPPPTYDTPPRESTQQIITTITTTTTTTTPSLPDRTSSSSNESPSVDHVLEQAVELQKMSNMNGTKQTAQVPFVIERTEQYQVFLDSSNHEVRRTPSISRTSIIPVAKSGHATDLDQAQAQVERLSDDHQAIQNLTRALHDHSAATISEYNRMPSQTASNPPSPLFLSSPVSDNQTSFPIKSEYSVIDALVNHPIGAINGKYNNLINMRFNEIITNLKDPNYLNSLKQPIKSIKDSDKKPKKSKEKKEKNEKTEKNSKEKNSKEKNPKENDAKQKNVKKEKSNKVKEKPVSTVDNNEQTGTTRLVNTSESLTTQKIDPTITVTLSEQIPLIDPKEKKKQDKENNKQDKESKKQDKENKKQDKESKKQDKENKKKQTKVKTKPKSKSQDYQCIDAIISSPIALRLPDSYIKKYNVNPPLSQSTPVLLATTSNVYDKSTTGVSNDSKVSDLDKNQALYYLVKIINELHLHHAAALTAASGSQPTKTTIASDSKKSDKVTKQNIAVVDEVVGQQPLLENKRTKNTFSKFSESRPSSETAKPRVVYRYMDESGHVLKISSTSPSELVEQTSKQYIHHPNDPSYYDERQTLIDDDRRHPLAQYEQRATWQGETKLPTTVTREDFEFKDKRKPQISDQPMPNTRTLPVTYENERSSRPSSHHYQQQQRTYHYPNQQNIKLAWLPLSYQPEQQYIAGGAAGYDTDSTTSERSVTHRPYDHNPIDSHYRSPNRPSHNDYYYNRSSGTSYYPPPPLLPYGGRGISPEYGGLSRNYIEVFRGGDFRETKPSEVYSLPLSDHIRTSPIAPLNNRHSRYDQYHSERYGAPSNRHHIPVTQQTTYYSQTLPNPRYQTNIPPSTVYTSSHYTHRSPYHVRTVQHSPNPESSNYVRQSKSFDYRPLRTKLQREYRITPNLLVDEWDYPQTPDGVKYSTATTTTNRSGLSSPDDVFITNRTNKG